MAGALTAGIAPESSGIAVNITNPVVAFGNNLVTQAINIAFGVQEDFSWTSLAASVVAASAMQGVGKFEGFNKALNLDKAMAMSAGDLFGAKLAAGFISGTISETVKVIADKDYKPDWGAVAADALGSAIGQVAGQKIRAAKEAERLANEQYKIGLPDLDKIKVPPSLLFPEGEIPSYFKSAQGLGVLDAERNALLEKASSFKDVSKQSTLFENATESKQGAIPLASQAVNTPRKIAAQDNGQVPSLPVEQSALTEVMANFISGKTSIDEILPFMEMLAPNQKAQMGVAVMIRSRAEIARSESGQPPSATAIYENSTRATPLGKLAEVFDTLGDRGRAVGKSLQLNSNQFEFFNGMFGSENSNPLSNLSAVWSAVPKTVAGGLDLLDIALKHLIIATDEMGEVGLSPLSEGLEILVKSGVLPGEILSNNFTKMAQDFIPDSYTNRVKEEYMRGVSGIINMAKLLYNDPGKAGRAFANLISNASAGDIDAQQSITSFLSEAAVPTGLLLKFGKFDRIVPNREKLISNLLADTNKKFPLSRVNAEKMLDLAPPGFKPKLVAGPGGEGADLVFQGPKGQIFKIENKSTTSFGGFKDELSHAAQRQATGNLVFVQVPEGTDAARWMSRFWGNRQGLINNPTPANIAKLNIYKNTEIVIYDPKGVNLLPRQPIYNPPGN